MKTFQSLSAWFRRLNARERVVVAGGAILSAGIIIGMLGLVPLNRRWADTRDGIAARADRLSRLQDLIAREKELRAQLVDRRREQQQRAGSLLRASTPALGVAQLQTLLQLYAEESGVTLTRVQVFNEAKSTASGVPMIPLELTAEGDIYGMTELLHRIQYGGKLLLVNELRINTGPVRSDGAEPLTWSVRLNGPYLAQP